MKIEKENTEQTKGNISKHIKKAVALGVMFTVGVSAFAHGIGPSHDRIEGKLYGNPSIEKMDGWQRTRETYSTDAISDMCKIIRVSQEAEKDGVITKSEEQTLKSMFAKYDADYGKGASKFVLNAATECFPSESLRYSVAQSVKSAAHWQHVADRHNDMQGFKHNQTLADYGR